MSAEPLVSIVLPTYNGSRFLAEAVASCRAQTYRNWELVIVDDGSTDGTPQLIERLKAEEPRIRSFRNDVNRKLPGTLNRGFHETRGEYLTWMSDDNLHRPESIARMVAYLQEHSDMDVVYTDYTVIDAEGRPLEQVAVKAPENLVYHSCVGLCFLYRRRVMELVGDYAEDVFLAEDYDFWFRAFMRCRLAPMHEDLHLIRRHPASLTDRFPAEISVVTHKVIERHLPELRRTKPDLGHETTLRVANESMRYGNPKKMRRLFFDALRQRPLRTWFSLPSARLPIAVFLGEPFARGLTLVVKLVRPGPPTAANA